MGLLKDIITGFSKSMIDVAKNPNTEEKEKKKEYALKELEKGNPEPYEMEFDELDDDMFKDYNDNNETEKEEN